MGCIDFLQHGRPNFGKLAKSTQATTLAQLSLILTLPSGVLIEVTGHEPPSLSVLGSTRGLIEGEGRPLDDVSSLKS